MRTAGPRAAFLRLVFPCLLGLGLLTGAASSLPAEGTPDAALDVEVSDGLLSVELGEVPISEVLKAIEEQARLEINVRGDLGSVRPQAFQNVPLAEGIRRLIGSNQVNLIMRYKVDETGERRLATVRVRKGREVPAEERIEQRKRLSLSRVKPPPPPPPPTDIPTSGSP